MADGALPPSDLLELTAQIVAAHVSGNAVAPDALPALIRSVRDALAGVGPAAPDKPAVLEPAVPIKRSIQRDYLICLEDGGRVQMLKRYLATRFNLTPEAYRTKWGLPRDYPMVAPAYAERRSALAKQFGLGQGRAAARGQVVEPEPVEELEANHTVESVFGTSKAATPKPARGKPTKRKAFSEQSIRKGRPRRTYPQG